MYKTYHDMFDSLKLGCFEFVMAGVRRSAIVNPAGQLLLSRRFNNN